MGVTLIDCDQDVGQDGSEALQQLATSVSDGKNLTGASRCFLINATHADGDGDDEDAVKLIFAASSDFSFQTMFQRFLKVISARAVNVPKPLLAWHLVKARVREQRV